MKATRTLLRGLAILEALAVAEQAIGPSELSSRVGLDKATTGRLLFTLCEAGWAAQDHGGTYRPTTKLLQVARHVSEQAGLREHARPHLLALRDATGETVHLGVVEDDCVVYIDKLDGTYPVRLVSAVGQAMPLHTTSLGKAALAWMPQDRTDRLIERLDLRPRTEMSLRTTDDLRADLERTRARGYAIDDRENESQALCLGGPVLDSDGDLVAAVSVSGPRERLLPRVGEFGDRVSTAARRISDALAGNV